MNQFKLSAITASLMFSFSHSYAAEIQHTCTVQSECNYGWHYSEYVDKATNEPIIEKNWVFNSDIIGSSNDTLSAKLIPQHYQNKAATTLAANGSNTNLISIMNSSFNPITSQLSNVSNYAHLFVPAGTTATLSELSGTGSIFSLHNAEATIEKGVKLTIEPSYEEKHNLTGENAVFLEAIHAYGKNAKVTTSADITSNARDSAAISVFENAQLIASDHTITLNAIESEGVLLNGGSKAILNNVTISGNNHTQTGVYAGSANAYAQLNNSSISLTHNHTAGVGTYGGTIDLNNSKVVAELAITTDAFGYANSNRTPTGNHNVVNISNSTIVGRDALLAVNPDTDGSPNVNQLTTHSSVLNAENSYLSGEWQRFLLLMMSQHRVGLKITYQ